MILFSVCNRYHRGDDPLSERDLPKQKRAQRIKEKEHEAEFTKGYVYSDI